ncbi:MAG: trypsin-like peptidase domain-containing protein [Pseudomonadota bacterium]
MSFFRSLSVAALFFLATAISASAQDADVIERADEAVVRLLNAEEGGLGSGFLVSDDGIIVTNAHVVGNASEIFILRPGALGNEILNGRVIDRDGRIDLALIQVRGLNADPLPINVGDLDRGQGVFALGFPGAADGLTVTAEVVTGDPNFVISTVTSGEVSRVITRDSNGVDVSTIQHTAAIGPGNSGGPLLDFCGSVVGVNTRGLMAAGGGATILEAPGAAAVQGMLDRNNVDFELRTSACSQSPLPYVIAGLVAALLLAATAVILVRRNTASAGITAEDRSDLSRRLRALEGGGRTKSAKAPAPAPASMPAPVGASAAAGGPIWRLKFEPESGKVGIRFTSSDAAKGILIGRDRAAGLTVDGASVSRRHALIRFEGDAPSIEDLGSTNGTFVDGARLREGDRVRLGDGATIALGRVKGELKKG